MEYIIYFILIAVAVFFINKFLSQFKFPKVTAVSVFVGGLKAGKTATSLACAVSNYKRVHRNWRIKRAFVKFLNLFRKNKKEFDEEPLFYSNIPLRHIKYVSLTTDHLLRKKRFNYGSITFIDEVSLVCDSQLIKDKVVNTQLLLFFKLYGHETRGGKCFVSSHTISDLHYALKRVTSQYFYVHHLSKYIPFFTICYMREERYSEDSTTINDYNEDVEVELKRCIMRSSVFKKYDCYCYSYFTDHLPTDCSIKVNGKKDKLKAEKIVSFRPEFNNLTVEEVIQNELQGE